VSTLFKSHHQISHSAAIFVPKNIDVYGYGRSDVFCSSNRGGGGELSNYFPVAVEADSVKAKEETAFYIVDSIALQSWHLVASDW
jgi:hypothetical protein